MTQKEKKKIDIKEVQEVVSDAIKSNFTMDDLFEVAVKSRAEVTKMRRALCVVREMMVTLTLKLAPDGVVINRQDRRLAMDYDIDIDDNDYEKTSTITIKPIYCPPEDGSEGNE